MTQMSKSKEKEEIQSDSADCRPDFTEHKKPFPIPKKKRMPSLIWLADLLDFLSDLFT